MAGEAAVEAVISIHALAKRATRFWNKTPKNQYHFNPRPRKEGDPLAVTVAPSPGDFNPRPRKEGDVRHYQSLSFSV